jgi:putative oxidoreductase
MKNMSYSGEMPRRNVIGRFILSNRKVIIEVISALFILLFLYTAINKFFSFKSLTKVLPHYPIIGGIAPFVMWALPITEIAVSVMLFIPRYRLFGLYCSLVLLSAFTIYIGYMFAFTPKLPCTCGGMLQALTWQQHLAFNIFAVMLSLAGIRLYRIRFTENESNNSEIIFT